MATRRRGLITDEELVTAGYMSLYVCSKCGQRVQVAPANKTEGEEQVWMRDSGWVLLPEVVCDRCH